MAKAKAKSGTRKYSNGRVQRGPAPEKVLKKTTYRDALPELKRDFDCRCAYCMRRIETDSEMQVDHFDPRKKNDKVQVYANLFLSDAHCNGAKGDTWPAEEERASGCRFLNCCDEQDYDSVIFEDLNTHYLVGKTPAAKYHIEMIDLNDPGLVEARKYRFDLLARLEAINVSKSTDPKVRELYSVISEDVKRLIPPIKGLPGTWTSLPIMSGIRVSKGGSH